MPAPEIPRRVTLLCRSMGLGVDLLALLVEECAINVISAPQELARGEAPADVVVVDVPAEDRRAVCEAVRSYYRGQLIVVLSPGDDSHDLPPDRRRTLLSRPFSMHDLAVVLTASGQGLPASDPVAPPRLLLPPGPKDRGANTGMGQRRLVRMSAILAAAALAFMAAFSLANQHHRCRPHCDELAGAGALTSSSGTTVQALGVDPETIGSGVDVASPTTTSSSGGLTAVGGSGTDVATSGGTRSSSTTSRPGGLPSPTAPSGSTRPQPTSSVSTAPTTTRSKPTTTTTSSTTTTTTTTTVPGQLGR